MKKEIDFLEEIKSKESIYNTFGKFEHYKLCKGILEKIIHIKTNLQNETNLITIQSSLRYTFETLVQTELLFKNPKYTFTLFYSLYIHQIEKREKLIKQLNKEISLLIKCDNKQNAFIENLKKDINEENKKNTEFRNKLRVLINENEERLIEKLQKKEILLYFEPSEETKKIYSHIFLMKKLLKDLESELNSLKEEKIKKAKEILNDNRINNLFDFKNQHSKVFSELMEKKSWVNKAKEAGMSEEYEYVYDLTSSLIHCTSYSLITSNSLINDEYLIANKLINQYCERILEKMRGYLETDKFNNIFEL